MSPLIFTPLTRKSPTAHVVERLYLDAFPAEERRPVTDWWRLAEDESPFTICAVCDRDSTEGLLTAWHFPLFTYVEHFAILPSHRGAGTGGAAIDAFIHNEKNRPVVLEIEPPDTPDAVRRATFYARHGFHPSPRPYLQPPYRSGGKPFPLLLLSTDFDFLTARFDDIVRTLHIEVYEAK